MAKKKQPSPGRIKQMLKNPGLRSTLADKYLTPELLAKRNENRRLARPVVPGSSMTNRDLAHARDAAVQVQYGPEQQALGQQLATQRQQQRDMGGFFDQYINDVRQAATRIQGNNAAANTAMQNLVGAAGKIPTALGSDASSQNVTDAQNASAIRQALLASFGSTMTATGRNAENEATTRGFVVAPGQKLQNQAQGFRNISAVREKQTELGQRKGAFASRFVGDTKSNEAKNVLAAQALGLDITKAKQSAVNQAGAGGEKYGYTPSEWLSLSASQRAAIVKASKPKTAAPGASQMATQAAKHGYTLAEWRNLSTQERRDVIAKDQKTGGAKKVKPVTGPGSLTPQAEQKVVSQINKVYQALAHPTKVVLDANKNQTIRPASVDEVLARLRSQAIDPNVINVARSLLANGGKGLGPWGVQNAHDLGIHVGSRWKIIKGGK